MKQGQLCGMKISNGQYQINNKIYQSRQQFNSSVYEGRILSTNEMCAIKVYPMEKLKSNEKLYNRVKQEIICLQKCNSINILRYIDQYQSDDYLYIITEYCSDGTLLDEINRHQQGLLESDIQGIFAQLLNAYYEIYKNKIAHRDLKPENILIQGFTYKIADFGFAKALDSEEQLMETNLGTACYQAPEIREQKQYTYKSDIFSLGVILYYMSFGCLPFSSFEAIMNTQSFKDLQINFNPQGFEISKSLKNLIQKMLQQDPLIRISYEDILKEQFIDQQQITKLISITHCSVIKNEEQIKYLKQLNSNSIIEDQETQLQMTSYIQQQQSVQQGQSQAIYELISQKQYLYTFLEEKIINYFNKLTYLTQTIFKLQLKQEFEQIQLKHHWIITVLIDYLAKKWSIIVDSYNDKKNIFDCKDFQNLLNCQEYQNLMMQKIAYEKSVIIIHQNELANQVRIENYISSYKNVNDLKIYFSKEKSQEQREAAFQSLIQIILNEFQNQFQSKIISISRLKMRLRIHNCYNLDKRFQNISVAKYQDQLKKDLFLHRNNKKLILENYIKETKMILS